MTPDILLTNRPFDEIRIGETVSITRTLSADDIAIFAVLSGDRNPAHLDENFAKNDFFHHIVGHGMLTGALFSALLGMQLPGPGTIYLSQSLRFLAPVAVGDSLTVTICVIAKHPQKPHVTFSTYCTNQHQVTVLTGEAVVIAPTTRITWPVPPLPHITLHPSRAPFLEKLTTDAAKDPSIRVGIVHPTTKQAIEGAVLAARHGIIEPVFIGPEDKIRKAAEDAQIDISSYVLIPTEHSHAAVARSIAMVKEGQLEALMKGKVSTEELMEQIVKPQDGLRTARRMSHVFVMDIPDYPKPLFLTDAALNIQPRLKDKKDIVQNAIDLFHLVGLGTPYVAILSAVETVNEKIPSTLDATALCKMAQRGQIKGGILDGPLAFDNAISAEAAHIKEIYSNVAGQADILVVPDLESGNMLYKQLSYFSDAHGAGTVMGAKVPIILTSRASDVTSRLSSAMLAQKVHHYKSRLCYD